MSYTRTNVTDFTQLLAHSMFDSTILTAYYDRELEDLGRLYNPPLLATATFNITGSTSDYTFPSTAIDVFAVFHIPRQLSFQVLYDMETYSASWRDDTTGAGNKSVAYTVEDTSARTVRFYPIPTDSTANGGRWIYSEARTSNVPSWLVLPITFRLLARNFAYPSDHQDIELAALCDKFAAQLEQLAGIGREVIT